MTKYIKLTNSTNTHNGFTFKSGLNIDTRPFTTTDEFQAGGIYYTTIEHFSNWINYNGFFMCYVWDVEIPNDAQTMHFETKSKSDRIILSNMRTLDHFLYHLSTEKLTPPGERERVARRERIV